jgi:DNA-directed RNA polymerase omega subunit
MTKKTIEEIEDIDAVDDEGSSEPEVIDPPEIDSKYRMILLAAQRSKQLQRGAHPRVDMDIRKRKPTRIALKELEQRKVNFEILEY